MIIYNQPVLNEELLRAEDFVQMMEDALHQIEKMQSRGWGCGCDTCSGRRLIKYMDHKALLAYLKIQVIRETK